MRVWIRKLPEEHPSSINQAAAGSGFRRIGAETEYYSEISEVMDRISRDDIIVDGVDQLNDYFRSLYISTNTMDYPDILLPFAGRPIRKDTLGNVRRGFLEPVFIKPVKEKLFPGTVIRTVRDWTPLVHYPLSQEVWCSPVMDIYSEFRAFVRYDRIVDVRPYRGDYHFQFNPEELDQMMNAFTAWEQRPNACAIDIAVTSDWKTVFLELNDAYAIGAYGLNPVDYALLITTRWAQLIGFQDPYETYN